MEGPFFFQVPHPFSWKIFCPRCLKRQNWAGFLEEGSLSRSSKGQVLLFHSFDRHFHNLATLGRILAELLQNEVLNFTRGTSNTRSDFCLLCEVSPIFITTWYRLRLVSEEKMSVVCWMMRWGRVLQEARRRTIQNFPHWVCRCRALRCARCYRKSSSCRAIS